MSRRASRCWKTASMYRRRLAPEYVIDQQKRGSDNRQTIRAKKPYAYTLRPDERSFERCSCQHPDSSGRQHGRLGLHGSWPCFCQRPDRQCGAVWDSCCSRGLHRRRTSCSIHHGLHCWACRVTLDRGVAEEGQIELPEPAIGCRKRPACSTSLDRKSLTERSGYRLCWLYRGGPNHELLSHRRRDVQHRDDNGKSCRRLFGRERSVV